MKHGLGKGDKPTISGDPQDMGLNARKRTSNSDKLRGETNIEQQRPTIKKGSISSDRGTFPFK
ncbi:MAG: hypothetical protein V3R76_00280 [Gammaproteobacteria bacterium]